MQDKSSRAESSANGPRSMNRPMAADGKMDLRPSFLQALEDGEAAYEPKEIVNM